MPGLDGVNTETIDYTYDDLDRLLTASVPTGESFAYDANGSMTARGTQTIKYDPEQRPIRIQDGTPIHRSAYDGDGVRRKRDDSNGTVHYLGGYERKLAAGSNSPETVTKYYSASFGAMSRPVAFRRGGTLHWVGSDHLGGTIRVLNSSFTALDGMRYKPYGEDRDAGTSLNTDRKFTGQTEDEAAGLYWYASRAYDPEIGRFVSPDPIVPEPGNPQSLNRYSYVYNNPLGMLILRVIRLNGSIKRGETSSGQCTNEILAKAISLIDAHPWRPLPEATIGPSNTGQGS